MAALFIGSAEVADVTDPKRADAWNLRHRLRDHIRTERLDPPSWNAYRDTVVICGRAPQRRGIASLRYDPVRQEGFWSGLQTCDRPYCPVCGPTLRQRRGALWAATFAGAVERGADASQVTLTVRHTPADELHPMFWGVLGARSGLFRSEGWKALRGQYDLIGTAYATHVVYEVGPDSKRGGWYPHVHCWPFSRRQLSADDWDNIGGRMAEMWCRELKKQNLYATLSCQHLQRPIGRLGGIPGWAHYGPKSGQWEWYGPRPGYKGWRHACQQGERGRQSVDTKGLISDEMLYEHFAFGDTAMGQRFRELATVFRSAPPLALPGPPHRGPNLYWLPAELKQFAGLDAAAEKILARSCEGGETLLVRELTPVELLALNAEPSGPGRLRRLADDPQAVEQYLQGLLVRDEDGLTGLNDDMEIGT